MLVSNLLNNQCLKAAIILAVVDERACRQDWIRAELATAHANDSCKDAYYACPCPFNARFEMRHYLESHVVSSIGAKKM